MATLEALRTIIKSSLQDPYFTEEIVNDLINNAITYTSGRVLLTELEAYDETVSEVGKCSVDIPDDWNFHRNLFACSVADNPPIYILGSQDALRRFYPHFDTELEEGQIEFVVAQKGTLIYYPIPSEVVTLCCNYYSKAPLLTADNMEPTCIPAEFQEDIIENRVLYRGFSRKEDGMEGIKINTKHCLNAYEKALEDLDDATASKQSRPVPYREGGWE